MYIYICIYIHTLYYRKTGIARKKETSGQGPGVVALDAAGVGQARPGTHLPPLRRAREKNRVPSPRF